MLGPVRTFACDECGDSFEAQRSHRRLCSAVCRRKRAAANKADAWGARPENAGKLRVGSLVPCAICARLFIAKSGRAKYCSPDCVRERNNQSATRSYWNRPENKCREPSKPRRQTPGGRKLVRKNRRLIDTYGITLDDLNRMKASQGDACLICREKFQEERDRGAGTAHVDHCHDTGTVRGILCHNCNVGLGAFLDRPDLLRAAATYIEAARKLRFAS